MPHSNAVKLKRSFWRRKRFWAFLVLGVLLLLFASCRSTRMIMKTAPSKPNGPLAHPAINVTSVTEWEAGKPALLKAFADHIYGGLDVTIKLEPTRTVQLDGTHFNGSANLEFQHFEVFKNGTMTGRNFGMVIVRPAKSTGPTPIIMMQNFCPNHDVIPHPDVPRPDRVTFSCAGDGFMAKMFTYFFGRYITTPPIDAIMKRGYALAIVYPSEFVPDDRHTGQTVLDTVFADQPRQTRTGAIAAWALQFSAMSTHLESDARFSEQIAYGHSRFGKSALLAAAINTNIDAVISHQSGTGGASLTRDKPGETLADITQGYPFWFSPSYAAYRDREADMPIDQHQLLALIAPRPVLLGNARRDVWSDPNGAFRAAQGATPVYDLYGKTGLGQAKLTDFTPEADIVFWMRPGTHGVVKEDWPAFLTFLDRHIK